eukprot:CAMPEP_0171074568 /NCGR_PEP_ID=MMETSP0766_2-20121228/12228_1 /TAXON_ID=439317 /ORGANISM="Gambierdiscus australes, Strain CAWD 149" /LENGTH=58 /DNA_ID=CAMNT_0011531375 /DNA_START=84 /DNA_END=256 /DNA_ORIENTATION=+
MVKVIKKGKKAAQKAQTEKKGESGEAKEEPVKEEDVTEACVTMKETAKPDAAEEKKPR